jgi:NADH-quinone oxidoreductase subunit L
LDPNEVLRQFAPIYEFIMHKWYFDELYDALFVQPALFVSRRVAEFDKQVIDGIIDNLAVGTKITAYIEDFIDRHFVDGFVNIFADWTYGIALWFRGAETGRVRQYVMFIVVGTVGMFVLITFYLAAP